MNKHLPIIITLSALALISSACTQQEQKMHHKAPGSYESTETSTDAKGTTTVKESTTEVTVDEYGHRKETITSKTSKDPRGLMNKTTTKKTSKTIQQ